ncbi:MAG: hypothetical protein ACKPKO_47590, partial [Candidatus Fonsibacter sp.]
LGANDKIIRYSELRHINDLDELLTNYLDYCTILYEDRPDRGHWTALSRYHGIYEHFDSYGHKPDKSLEWVNMKMRRRLKQVTPYLTDLIIYFHGYGPSFPIQHSLIPNKTQKIILTVS